jgi:hypothetical protein
MKGRFGLNKKADPISELRGGNYFGELTIIVLADQPLFCCERLCDVGEVLADSPLWWILIGPSDLIWAIHGTLGNGD